MEESSNLEAAFGEEEVLATIKSSAFDKAPVPDGFTMAFFQSSWEFIKTDILAAMQHYHQHCWILSLEMLHSYHLFLKKVEGGASELRDYRPISLIGSIYKIIAKVLANRLKTVMGKLVPNQQNAFIKGRKIIDASLIANEVLDW